LQLATLEFLAHCGFEVKQSVTRSYVGSIGALPSVTVLFQRPRDIMVSVANGGVDFGITGYDVIAEANAGDKTCVIHDALGFGKCRLVVAVPETWTDVIGVADLARKAAGMSQPLRVVTKYPHLTADFLRRHAVHPFTLIDAEGSLEVVPEIGYADIIVDVVETGATLQQNRLRALSDGVMLFSQAALVANRAALQRSEVMHVAVALLEYFEAHLRAEGQVMVFANMRGVSAEEVAHKLHTQTTLGGLQGPTVAPVFPPPAHLRSGVAAGSENWYAVNLVVRRSELTEAIQQLRSVGGSGVVVTPVTYIFEEQPERVRALKTIAGVQSD
ncbi:MAG: ATP phosphoribosyltransferase, partial [Anaerolineae bacterium]|nr:ATP phosphoribosyltransferase [Thermoflexales bacterium]MDW8408741.1 ATP phosphoribosyltransferase [Anaerolineae bacterium]